MKPKLLWDNNLKAQPLKPNEATSYGYGHTAPLRSDENYPLSDLSGGFGKDLYGPRAQRLFGQDPDDLEVLKIIQAVRNNPEAEITIYRGVPEGVTTINKGDWVTLSQSYAQKHSQSNLGDKKGVVLARKVKVKDLVSEANSLQEFGYDPED
jgi:hypothetical protein